jgi:diguanylate cyclase
VHAAGVSLAVDDFGTGYAGLDYLRRFPVDILKIDKSFVHGLGSDSTDTAIIVSLITLGRALDVTVVAEGVENEVQRNTLRGLQCPQGQGRLWSPPVRPERIAQVLAAGPAPAAGSGLGSVRAGP